MSREVQHARDTASKIVAALERGCDRYESRLRTDHREPTSSQGREARRLIQVVRGLLARREQLVEWIAACLAVAPAAEDLPRALLNLFARIVERSGEGLPRAVSRACRVPLRTFEDWALIYDETPSQPETAYEQRYCTALVAMVDIYLRSVSDVNEVIRLLETSPMHFFKTVVRSHKQRSRVVGDLAALPARLDQAPVEADFGRVSADLYRHLSMLLDERVWRPRDAWLTAALVDLGIDPLPSEVRVNVERSARAVALWKEYADRFVSEESSDDLQQLPRDRRVRLGMSLAILTDLLELVDPATVHGRYYQKHKRAVRKVREAARSFLTNRELEPEE